MDMEARKYLYDKYKGAIHVFDEDLSNMKYILSLLKEKTENRK
ncbi:hypothetical protein [Clostridium algidicarnis]|nr:hypothetical protein [Clostridium algidicarnis]